MSDPIYLDNHATTQVDPRVLEAMWPWFADRVGNAASVSHSFGTAAASAVEVARGHVASLIGASPEEIIFTSGATEADNLALKGSVLTAAPSHLVVNAAEHRAILDPARRLKRQGIQVTVLPVDGEARLDVDSLAEVVTPSTTMVSAMLANNEVGTINPIADVVRFCRGQGVLTHTDAAQAVGRIPVDVAALDVDLLSFTAHKLYGPQGVGALYVRKTDPPLRLTPQIEGGGHERRLRSGTLPVALLVGFGEACRVAALDLNAEFARLSGLRDRLQNRLLHDLDGVDVNGCVTCRLPGNLNVSISGVDGDALMAGLEGVAVSSGSACSSADPQPSHVLRAMGLDDQLVRASLRFGVGRFNTEEQIDRAASTVIEAVQKLRSAS